MCNDVHHINMHNSVDDDGDVHTGLFKGLFHVLRFFL